MKTVIYFIALLLLSSAIKAQPFAQAGMLPTVRLLSTDEVSTVIKYYKKELSDWESKDLYGTFTFFKGDETEAMMGQIPVIQIGSAEMFSKTMPNPL